MRTLLCLAIFTFPLRAAEPPRVVFVSGDEEYRSEETLPFLAKMLEKHHGFKTAVLYAVDPKDGTVNPNQLDSIHGLDALKDADLMVMFTRYRKLPDDQLKMILDYANSGKPMVGFRTATHAFKYDSKDRNAEWNDKFGREVWGQKWITHHGHEKGEYLTEVHPMPERRKHPILNGVNEFKVPSWLYHVDGGGDKLFGDCHVLATGTSLVSGHQKANKLERYPISQPVAWTKTYGDKKARVFFTTLGHPHDFKQESMRKLTLNGIFWALGKETEIPVGGVKTDLIGEFDLTDAGVGKYRKGVKP